MARPSSCPALAVLVVMTALILAACVNPDSPTTVPSELAVDNTPTATRTTATTPTPQPPTPTPSATPTPTPQPISFVNISQLQVINNVVNYDEFWDTFSLALSPDGTQAAVAGCLREGDDKACHGTTFFRIFDVQSGEILLDPQYLSPAIEVLAFSPDGSVIAAAGCDISLWLYGQSGTVCDMPRAWLVDTATGAIIAELSGYTSHVTDFAFSTDGTVLFTSVKYHPTRGDGDHVIRAYDVHTGEKIATVETGMINCTQMLLDISPDGHYLVGDVTSACGRQSFVAWWDISDPHAPFQVGTVDSFGYSEVSPDSTQILVYNSKDRTFKVYDLATGAPLATLPRFTGLSNLKRFSYLSDRDTLILDLYYEYDIFDIPSGQVIRRIQPPDGAVTYGYRITPDLNTLLTTYYTNGLHVDAWDIATWQSSPLIVDPMISLFLTTVFDGYTTGFTPDGTALVTVSLSYGLDAMTWGFPDAFQDLAAQALRDYFDLLVSGDYASAAALYMDESYVRGALGEHLNFYPYYPASLVALQLPDMDFSDWPGALASLCALADFPCLPVRDILYQEKVTNGLYHFTVTFASPDGSLADWPLCDGIPDSYPCDHRGGVFDYFVYQQPGGDFMIVEGFPPAIGFLLKY